MYNIYISFVENTDRDLLRTVLKGDAKNGDAPRVTLLIEAGADKNYNAVDCSENSQG